MRRLSSGQRPRGRWRTYSTKSSLARHINRAAVFAGATGFLALATSNGALASTGCTSLASGNYATTALDPHPPVGNPVATGTGFTAGDVITGTIPSGLENGIWLDDQTLGTVVGGVYPLSLTFTYTVPATTTNTLGIHVGSLNGGVTASWSCTPSSSSSSSSSTTNSNTPLQSVQLHSLQTSVTPSVAQTSGALISSAIDSGIGDAFSPNGTPTNFGPNGGFINFAAPEPKSQTASRVDEAFGALGYAGAINKAPNYNKEPLQLDRVWSAWADIRGTGWKAEDPLANGNSLKGDQLNVTAGVGRKLSSDTLIGLVGGYESFKYDVAALSGSVKGDGGTIGGYFAQRFGGNLRFDAAVAWSNVDYKATAGTATGSFTGSRWLASTGLTGTYKYNVYFIEPSAKVYALWESEKAWIDSLGTLQPSRNFSAGRTAVGAKIGRPFDLSNGWTVTPNAGLYGDWRFQSDSAIPTAIPVANIGTGWSGRVTGGLTGKAANGCMISLDGEYGGLGATYKIWTGSLRATVPL